MSIFNPSLGEQGVTFVNPLHRLADHYPIPFLTGTDGLTWRQREASARRYAATMRLTTDDVIRVRARLAAMACEHPNAT